MPLAFPEVLAAPVAEKAVLVMTYPVIMQVMELQDKGLKADKEPLMDQTKVLPVEEAVLLRLGLILLESLLGEMVGMV